MENGLRRYLFETATDGNLKSLSRYIQNVDLKVYEKF